MASLSGRSRDHLGVVCLGGQLQRGRVLRGRRIYHQAFVVSEVHGRWRKAEVVPGTAALNINEYAQITSVSCASAGNCSAGGYHKIGYHTEREEPILQAFVVSEVNGTWHKSREVPATESPGSVRGLP